MNAIVRSHIVDGFLFTTGLAVRLPEVEELLDEADLGVIHLEVGVLKLATRHAILRRDLEIVREHFAFLSFMLERTGSDLRTAIKISYLGSLFYGETALAYMNARALLPARMAELLDEVERDYAAARQRYAGAA